MPEQEMSHPPIGIDLGTTHSLIAVFDQGQPRLIPNALGSVLTPSAVSLDADRIVTGQAARDRQASHPELTATAFKRAMGTDRSFNLGGKRFRAEDLSSFVLRKLKEDAEAALGCPIRDVVVTVPAYFNQVQRQATLAACALAGLNVKRLVNEPTAAALAYGLQDRDGESQFLVFDLGGGTFDCTLLEHFDGVMEVKASSGDAQLGGEDFTLALAKSFAERLQRPWARLEREIQNALRMQADRAKVKLTGAEHVEIDTVIAGAPVCFTLTRESFEEAANGLIKRLYRPIERCFYDSREGVETLDRIILVGGATRMPMIRQLVARQFRMLPEMTIDPDHAVALGAAVQAGLVAEDRALDDVVMTDVSPFSVGVETASELENRRRIPGLFSPIIERNTPLPTSRVETFCTIADNQESIRLTIYQGEAPKVADNIRLGELIMEVPAQAAGKEAVDVRMTYDTSGLIEVEATSRSTEKRIATVIDQSGDTLSETEIAQRLATMSKLKTHPRDDEANVALLARIRRLYEMSGQSDRMKLQDMMVKFEGTLEDQDPRRIETERAELSRVLDAIDDYYVS